MAKKEMTGGGWGMGNVCGTISGIVVLASGAALLAFALGALNVMTAHIIAGAGLGLYGIVMLVHALGLCPMCSKM